MSHIDLTVSDAERSAVWYRDTLEMEHVLTTDSTDTFAGRVFTLISPGTRVIISMVEHERPEPGAFSEFRVGLDHFALEVATRGDLEEWTEHFDRMGVAHSGISDMPYGSVLVFRDPDGIQLELFAFPPR